VREPFSELLARAGNLVVLERERAEREHRRRSLLEACVAKEGADGARDFISRAMLACAKPCG